MRQLPITHHLSVDDLKQRHRGAHDPVERSHGQMILLHAQGHPVKTMSQLTTYSPTWMYEILHRYDAHGPKGVGDRRHQNPGQVPLVPPDVREKLAAALDGPAPDGGFWTSKNVAAWLAQALGGEPIPTPRGWELLQQLGYRAYVPRPQHRRSDPEAQAAWKKNCPT
jgi:transposase